MKKGIIIYFLTMALLLSVQDVWGWASAIFNDHGKLAASAEKCVPLPKPPTRRCENPVDDNVLYGVLKKGASEPDFKDGDTSPKHSFNPVYESNKNIWDPKIRAVLNLPNSAINEGAAIPTIESEKAEAKGQLQGLNCDSGQQKYIDLWHRFGRLSHYASDMASPLHAYSVSVNGVYHEGDYYNGDWLKGLYDLGFAGKRAHWETELQMGRRIDEMVCSTAPVQSPAYVAGTARETLNYYYWAQGWDMGFPELVRNLTTYREINTEFFYNYGLMLSKYASGAIQYVWKEALSGFTPPSNCEQPPTGGCGDCGGGSCTPPGGDHPDDNYSVATSSSTPPTSEELLEQSWDRLAVKKDKKSLIWFWMQSYLYGEYMLGNIDEATYKSRSESYDLTSDVAWELFYNDYITSPDAAILGRGFALSMSDLLQNKFNEPVRRFTVNDFSPDALKDYPVFVIPSGALMGLENSDVFKASLNEYVKQGGTVIVFSQQHGYEFSALPVPQEVDGTYKTITGYGWTEDQSCLWNGTYIDTYHQMLSATSRSTVSANVDGYFTNYPSNATVLLRRTANGQPAMLMYDYGQGKVVVSSIFSDWGHAHSQDNISI